MKPRMEKYKNINCLVLDIDGTMTDGGVYYDDHGNELKKFCVKDGAGFFCAHASGMKILVITGRCCEATNRRMKEMKVDYLYQNISDKYHCLKNFMEEHQLEKENIAYVGDDLNDLYPMTLAGFVGCPKDACNEVKDMADYISELNGGCGAVRDVVSHILKQRGQWTEIYTKVYGIGE